MTTLKAALKSKLTGDTALMALAVGGVFDAESVGREGLTLDDLTSGTPLVKAAVFLRWSTAGPISARAIQAREVFVEIYVYQHSGYDTCRKMRDRLFALLDGARVAYDDPAGEWLFELRWAGDVTEQRDDSLGGASMERSRYVGYLVK